jgi:hypothetical protein
MEICGPHRKALDARPPDGIYCESGFVAPTRLHPAKAPDAAGGGSSQRLLIPDVNRDDG